MDLKILVAAHKKYRMPIDEVYLPIHAGRKGKEDLGYRGDDTGDNISAKNANYCELTVLYWAWKNLQCDYLGLCHYRRYFGRSTKYIGPKDKTKAIFSEKDYEALLTKYDVILPKKRNYYIETVRSQYGHAHNLQDLEEAGRVIALLYPEYTDAFKAVMNRRSLYIYNMFVMKKALFDIYAKWLFGILFELEKKIDLTGRSSYDARVFGFLAERLFNVWLEKQELRVKEVDVVCLEKINWTYKILNFLKRKFNIN